MGNMLYELDTKGINELTGEPVTTITTNKIGLAIGGVAGVGMVALATYGVVDLVKKAMGGGDDDDE